MYRQRKVGDVEVTVTWTIDAFDRRLGCAATFQSENGLRRIPGNAMSPLLSTLGQNSWTGGVGGVVSFLWCFNSYSGEGLLKIVATRTPSIGY
jgi:hypothetical protein